MLGKVEPLNFVLGCDSKANGPIHELKDEQRTNGCDHPGNCHANQLIQQLVWIAFDNAGCQNISVCIAKNRIYSAGCEHASEQCAQGSTCPMDTERIQGIVVSELRFDGDYHEIAENAGAQTDQQGGHG